MEYRISLKRLRWVFLIVLIVGLPVLPAGLAYSEQQDANQLQNELYFPLIQRIYIDQIPTTRTPRPPRTAIPTRTRIPFRSATPNYTATQTLTPTLTPTNTPTPTYTSTTTLIPLVSITIQFPSSTPSSTPTSTSSPTVTPSATAPAGGVPGIPPSSWLVIILVSVLWVILAAWLFIFLRQRQESDPD